MTTCSRLVLNTLVPFATVAFLTVTASSPSASFAQTADRLLPTTPVTIATPAVSTPEPVVAAAAPEQPDSRPDQRPDQRQVECVAKIIMHEAANEPRQGRIAVAQVVRTRIKSGRFADSACGVAKQRGQFFDVDAFDPPRSTGRWSDAVAIATDTLNGEGDDVAPGAVFFHAAYAPMTGRARVAQIGGHIFYR